MLEGLRFPLDLGGGVARFRHRRGRLASGKLEVDLTSLARWLGPRLTGLFGATPRVTLSTIEGGVFVGIATAQLSLAFDLYAAPLAADLRLLIAAPRGEGLREPAQALALRALAQATRGLAELVGGAVILRDPLGQLARRAWPLSGARVPSTEGAELALDLDAAHAGRLGWTVRVDEPEAPLSPRVLSALERIELTANADRALGAGDHDAARRAYLGALELAPRHPDIARALAELDLRVFERPEAALSTLVDVMGAVDAGLLGSEVLEAVGEPEAAYAAAARAAAEETWGALAARAWLRAAQLAPLDASRDEAIENALLRDPSLEGARWARFEARLGRGDLRGAIADADHLELSAEGHVARHEVARRAAEALRLRGFLDAARARFERSIRWAPRSIPALVGLARTLSELGRSARALDLLARAATLEVGKNDASGEVAIELGKALVAVAQDRSAAVARVAVLPPTAERAPEARLLEAGWRAELGDRVGAGRALERLREIAEQRAGSLAPEAAVQLARALESAASLSAEQLDDARAAERCLALSLRIAPSSSGRTRKLRALVDERLERAQVAARAEPAPPAAAPRASAERPEAAEPAPGVPTAAVPEALAGSVALAADDDAQADDEQLVEQLSQKLRADPHSELVAEQLAGVLERLGRDLDLLALVSARLDEAPVELHAAWKLRRSAVLKRLAETARAEGRLDEASLYESLASGD